MNLFKINDEYYIITDASKEAVAEAILDTTKKETSLSDDDELLFDPYEYLVELLMKRRFIVGDYYSEEIKEFKL
jgi:hypothetical protein